MPRARKPKRDPDNPVTFDASRPQHAVKVPPLTERLRMISDECSRRIYFALWPRNRPKNFKLPP